MKLERSIKMKRIAESRLGKHLSDMFPINTLRTGDGDFRF